MNKVSIALRKMNGFPLPLPTDNNRSQSPALALTLNMELMNLGYMLSQESMETLTNYPTESLKLLATEVIANVRELKGAHVKHKPMYPNFPEQVAEMSTLELYSNALIHYFSRGEWLPEYDYKDRPFAFEDVKFKELKVISEMEFRSIFKKIVGSNDSISADDRQIIEWFFDNYDLSRLRAMFPSEIPFKENLCVVAAKLLESRCDVGPALLDFVNSATDVLRIVTYMNDGDISLATNTKFKSLPRRHRRMLTKILEQVANIEDIGRHRNKWIKLSHNLHVGEYSKSVYDMVARVRNNEHIETFNGRVQKAIDARQVSAAIDLLKQRPGEFARRLDFLMRTFVQRRTQIVTTFDECIQEVPTRVLVQLYGHFQNRDEDRDHRVVFPKGSVQKAVLLDQKMEKLPAKWVKAIIMMLQNEMFVRFGAQDDLGKVYVDPAMKGAPVPSQMRSASPGAFSVARGTRLPLTGDGDTVRLFVYWVGHDIDLSATFHNENFETIEQVSYTNLRSGYYQAYHSGDITNAPNGASEFVDINIPSALNYGARYVAMNVLIYSGHDSFAEMDTCFVGWMNRKSTNSNAMYEPKTVQQKIDMTQDARRSVPVMFDLKTREAIWVDLAGQRTRSHCYGNNIHSNAASIEQTTEAMVKMDHKMSLYDLFSLHGEARGDIVDNKEDADTVFAFEGTVTPYDIMEINAEYLK